ncbi:MAG: YCF48-related protein [Candidatus Eisenbacteria bacterium]
MRVSFRFLSAAVLALVLAGCSNDRVRIVVPPLSAVVLSVDADTVTVGGTAQFSATAFDLSSNPVSGVPFIWTSSNSDVFTVSASGRVTARGEGAANLFVEAGGQRDTASVLVLPALAGWFVQTSNSARQLNDVFFQSNGRHGCVVGNTGEILVTYDAGETWQRQSSGTVFNLNAVWFVSDSTGWAVGGNGTALRTVTGGRTWTLIPTGSSDNLMDVYFADPGTGWAVGSNGTVLTTTSGGSSWLKQNPTPNTLNGVSFAGTSNGWAVGNGGVILGSHDGGVTWFTVQPAVTALALNAVWRRSEVRAYAVGAAGAAPRTIATVDSTAWELRTAGAANNLNDVTFVSDSRGWAVGDNGGGIVRVSSDGGITWNPQTAPAGSNLRGVYFVDGLRGWAVGDNGRILHTGTGGD